MLGHLLDKVVFQPQKPEYLTYSKLKTHEIRLRELQGWRVEGSGANVGIYFGGNAEDVSLSAVQISKLGFRVVYLFNYRGYGLSGGRPSQRALYEDGLVIHDYVTDAEGVPVLVGRSLGASVAVYVSANRTTKRAVLVTPFTSMASLVREKAAPLHWFLRSRFPSDQYARTNTTPLLMVLAENDTLIPNSQSLPLFDLWQGPKELKVIRNAGHNDLHNRPEYEEIIRQFIQASPA